MQAGSFKAASSWVNALSWGPREAGGQGLLCVGCSDGSARLAAFETGDLGRAKSLGIPLPEPSLTLLLDPELNGVTTLDTAIQGTVCSLSSFFLALTGVTCAVDARKAPGDSVTVLVIR